ncbi:MAG: alpha/beta fold hydrolase [Actinomycetales bacterium]
MSDVIVLLHAFPLDHRMWAAQQVNLGAAGWEVLAVDLPGFGGSAVLDAEPSLVTVAAALADHLLAEGVERYALAGISLGGYVAMAMARRALAAGRPETIAPLLLCDTKASADTSAAAQHRIRLAETVLEDPVRCGRILRQALLPNLLGSTTHDTRPEVVAEVGEWLDQAEPGAVAWYQQAMAQRPDSHQVLRAFAAPTLVLWGEQDTLSPQPEQTSMLDALSDGQSAVIEGVGHLSVVEDPPSVSAAMLTILDGIRN